MKNFKPILSIFLTVALLLWSMPVKTAERPSAAPTQAGPAHPGQRPLPEDNETQKEYGKRIDAWEKQMQAYEASGQLIEEEQKEGAARAQESSGFSVDTPDEGLAAWLAAMRKKFPEANTNLGQKALTHIAKTEILPDVEQESIVLPGGGVGNLFVSPDGHYIMGFGDNGLKIWDTKNFYAKPIMIENIASSDMLAGGRGALLDEGRTAIQFFDIIDGALNKVKYINLTQQAVWRGFALYQSFIRFSPDGRYVALNNVKRLDYKPYVFVWDVHNFGTEPEWFQSDGPNVVFMPNSHYLAVLYAGKVRLWQRDVAGRFAANFIELKGDVEKNTYFLLSPDGRYLVGSNEGTRTIIMVWDMHNLEQEPRSMRFKKGFYGLPTFVGNNNVLAVVKNDSEGGMITDVYDLENLDAAPILLSTDYHLYSPDGRYGIYYDSCDVVINDLQYDDISRFLGVKKAAVVFLPNGKYLVTANDKAVTVWNWALVTRELERERNKRETEDKKRLPEESWFNWMTRIMPPRIMSPVSDSGDDDEGSDSEQTEEEDENE